jgi:hypothetical protein
MGEAMIDDVDWATEVGLSDRQVREPLRWLGGLFTAAGVEPERASEMSAVLVGLAADLGSFHLVDALVVIDALRAALLGEWYSLERFVPPATIGALREISTRRPASRVLAAYAALVDGVGQAAGDFARSAGHAGPPPAGS